MDGPCSRCSIGDQNDTRTFKEFGEINNVTGQHTCSFVTSDSGPTRSLKLHYGRYWIMSEGKDFEKDKGLAIIRSRENCPVNINSSKRWQTYVAESGQDGEKLQKFQFTCSNSRTKRSVGSGQNKLTELAETMTKKSVSTSNCCKKILVR